MKSRKPCEKIPAGIWDGCRNDECRGLCQPPGSALARDSRDPPSDHSRAVAANADISAPLAGGRCPHRLLAGRGLLGTAGLRCSTACATGRADAGHADTEPGLRSPTANCPPPLVVHRADGLWTRRRAAGATPDPLRAAAVSFSRRGTRPGRQAHPASCRHTTDAVGCSPSRHAPAGTCCGTGGQPSQQLGGEPAARRTGASATTGSHPARGRGGTTAATSSRLNWHLGHRRHRCQPTPAPCDGGHHPGNPREPARRAAGSGSHAACVCEPTGTPLQSPAFRPADDRGRLNRSGRPCRRLVAVHRRL